MKTHFLFLILACSVFSFAANEATPTDYETLQLGKSQGEGYTINFNDVSVVELIKFVSKISDVNFIYNEEELNFKVTITSEEPTTLSSIMAALIQILRVQKFEIIEEGPNLLIHRNLAVKQIATVVSEEVPYDGPYPLPMVTRVFRIKNANPIRIAALLKPLMSATAEVEVFRETRQLIVTDNTANVDKVAQLLMSLDSPSSIFEMDAYVAKENEPEALILLTSQILSPIAEGTPVTMVAQPGARTIFIVSTPFLIEKALQVLEDLDTPGKGIRTLSNENILLYRMQYKSAEVIDNALQQIATSFEDQNYASGGLIEAIKTMHFIKETNSLLFTGPPQTLTKVQELLSTIDVPGKPFEGFFIYKPQFITPEQLISSLDEIRENLEDSHLADPNLLTTIESAKSVEKTNSVIFTGNAEAIAQIKAMLPSIDTPSVEKGLKEELYIYRVQYVSPDTVEKGLDNLAKNLPSSDPIARTIKGMKWLVNTHSFAFRGPSTAIDRIKEVIALLDTPVQAKMETSEKRIYFLYKLQFVSGDIILDDLDKMVDNLESSGIENKDLIRTIKHIEWIKQTNSLYISGTPEIIAQVKDLVAEFDIPRTGAETTKFFVYKPMSRSPKDLKATLIVIAEDLQRAGLSDPSLLNTITTVRYVKETNSLIFTGTPDSIEKVKELLATIDVPGEATPIQHIGPTTFLVYRPKHVTSVQLMNSLKAVARNLPKESTSDRSLLKTLNTMRFVQETNSIIFVGPEETLAKVQRLLEKFDTGTGLAKKVEARAAAGYVIYTPKNQNGEDLIQTLKEFEENLIQSGLQEQDLFDVINNLKWMASTCSILISGNDVSVAKVEELLQRFDVPLAPGESPLETIDDVSFLIYKLQYHQGSAIETALQQVAADLQKAQEPAAGAQSKTPAPAIESQGLIEAINSIKWLEITNSLIGTGKPKTLNKLRELLKNIDTPLRQVFIEVLVIQSNITNNLDIGLRWGTQGKYMNKFGWQSLSNPSLPGTDPAAQFTQSLNSITSTTTPTGGGDFPLITGFDLGIIGDLIMHKGRSYIGLGSFLNALRQDSDISIVLDQKMIAQDSKNSTLFSGQNLPFTGSVVQNQSANTTTTANLEYIDVGISLSITPRLGENDIVTLDIDEQITAVTTNPASSDTFAASGIATSKTATATSVSVPDRHFLVLSGTMLNQVTRNKSSIPCLGGIPLIGLLFQDSSSLLAKDNVVIFIKPTIINTFADYDKLTAQQEDLYRSQAVPEEFDAGLELAKTPDDRDELSD